MKSIAFRFPFGRKPRSKEEAYKARKGQSAMTNTLITGGNRGLGYEMARRLIEEGQNVWITARSAASGREAAVRLGANFIQLDVTSIESVAAAVAAIEDQAGQLDVLINNAGILGQVSDPEDMTAEQLREVYETNVFGLVRVTHALIPLLRRAEHPSVINITSGMGSFGLTQDTERVESRYTLAAYGSSKSAVTMLTTQYAKTIPEIRFNAIDPGQTATEFTGHVGQTVAEGAEAAVRLAIASSATQTGTFTDRNGVLPW